MTTTLTEENREYVPAKMEDIPCMLCGDSEFDFHEQIGFKGKFQYVKCRRCSNVLLNPRPLYDQDYLDTAYSVYRMDGHLVVNHGRLNAEEEGVINRHILTLEHLERVYNKKGKILDVGHATGLFLLAAKRKGWSPFGIDISRPMSEFVSHTLHIPSRSGQFHELDLSSWGLFDVIYCSHVIEHIPNPIQWMHSFRKYLAPEGVVVLNVPNHYAPEKVVQRCLKTLRSKKDHWEKWRTPDHLYEPHYRSMAYLFEKTNFEVVEYFTYSSREERQSLFLRAFHRVLKWGSKHRYFLVPR